MKLTFFILLCLGGACVIIAEWYRDAEACQPHSDANGQPLSEPSPHLKPSHEVGRQLVRKIRLRMGKD